MRLQPGEYEVIVIGAGGGASADANGHHKTNYGMGATGGSGASFKGILKITSTEDITITTGAGGYATNNGGTAGTGGTSSLSGIVSCPGGHGGYTGGKHSNSPGSGAGKCTVQNASKFSSILVNAGGRCGSSGYCRHSKCVARLSGSSPSISVKDSYGGTCGITYAFRTSNRSISSGNCGYVKITYLR